VEEGSLCVLGHVSVDGRRVPSAAAASLLAYLVVHGPGPVMRDQAAFALWPDRDEGKARRTLSDTVYRMRAMFADGAAWLVASGDRLTLEHPNIDLWRLRDLANHDDVESLAAAIGLHLGPLADGVDDSWVDFPRRAHEEVVLGLCERVCASLPPSQRLPVARRWVEIDLYGTQSHHCLIETLLALDRRDAARRAIDDYRAVLDDLGFVDAEVDRWAALTADDDVAEVPFVGRRAERGRLLRALDDACDGRGGVAIVLGDAGIGKTRLLAEVVDAARWRGVDVSSGGALEHVVPRPLAPLDAALVDAFDEVRIAQAHQHLAADVRGALGAVVPGLSSAPVGGTDTTIERAVALALSWLAAPRPQLIVLDDAHWCGSEMWATLQAIAEDLTTMRVLVVVAARRAESLEAGHRAAIGALEALGAPVVHLGGLSVRDLDELLRAMGRDGDAEDLHDRSGGNPLAALADVDAEVHGVERVWASVDRSLARLGAAAHRLVQQAAALGRWVEYDVLAVACEPDGGDIFRRVVAAEEVGLLARRAGRLTFSHDLVRSAVLATIEPERITELHRRALAALAAVLPTATERLLGHAEAAGDVMAVVAYSIAAGTDALHQSAYRTAEAHFSRALEAGADAGDSFAIQTALGGRIRARDRLADREGQGADVQTLVGLAEPLGGDHLAQAMARLAEYHFALSGFEQAVAAIERGIGAPVAALVRAPAGQADLARIACLTLRELGRYEESAAIGEALAGHFDAAGDEFGAALMTDILGGIAWRRGDSRAAAALHQEAADRFAAIGALGAEARALNNLGTALWAVGDDHGAEAAHLRALDVCRELGDRQGEGDNLDNLGGVAYVRGDLRTAIELYRSALTIRRDTDDAWGVSISLSNLGDAHRALGELDDALRLIDESLEVNRAAGVVRNEATTLQGRGLVLADLGRLDDALADLRAAERLHAELGDRANLLETRSGIVQVLARTRSADLLAARDALAAEPLDDEPPRSRQSVHVALASASATLGDAAASRWHAAAAVRAMDASLAGLDPGAASLRRTAVPLHRATVELAEREGRVIMVDLAPADAPPGAAATTAQLVPVRWSVELPGDELLPEGAGRRRVVLLRLLAEAAAAGGAPTDQQLAAACGVTRRTVLRDIDALQADGHEVLTRRRRVSHTQ